VSLATVLSPTKTVKIFDSIVGSDIYLAQLLTAKNDTLQGVNFVHLGLVYSSNCTIAVDEEQYENFLLISINILFGQILLLCIIDRFGRKFPICK
jgi:hypothetical protein